MGVSRGVRDKTKLLLSGDEEWHGQHSIVVVAGQSADQWVVLEGHPQKAKSSLRVKMANPVTAGSIKGYKCTQWKEGKKWKRKNGKQGI